ncbi:MAG: hypothetical protein JWM16_2207 [Verrucomicrobiales bacterium]|nr:hypothetical protein [Verrucomicrobiales bacterium]
MLASLVISNGNSWSFGCFGHYNIELPDPEPSPSSARYRQNNLFKGWFTNGDFTLHPGEARVVTVQVPTNQASWRVNLTGREDRGELVEIGRKLLVEARKLGVPIRYRPTLYGVSSDFVKE